MKTILVTSDITYCPENYTPVLQRVLQYSQPHIAGVVTITINRFMVYRSLPFLRWAGCRNVYRTLRENLQEAQGKRNALRDAHPRLEIFSTPSINDPHAIAWLSAMKPDLIVNMRARCRYHPSVLALTRFGCLNVHHGLLPWQRGLFCDVFALSKGQATGFTIHIMTDRLDDGAIVYQETIPSDCDYIRYLDAVGQAEGTAISTVINGIATNQRRPRGSPNHCDQPILTTTPRLQDMKRFQYSGMVL